MCSSLMSFRQILDQHIVGQASVKEAVLLGLLAGEHVYIEGPPGVAKTFTAELSALGVNHNILTAIISGSPSGLCGCSLGLSPGM